MIRVPKLLAPLFAASILMLTISSCGSNSQITHSYVDPVLKKLDLSGVLIVGVTKQQSARIEFEDAFARSLSNRGVRAIASHTLVPNNDAKSEDVIAAATGANLDTILVTRYIGAMSQDVYHPGTIYYGVMPAYGVSHYGGFGSYYGHVYEVAYQHPVWTSNVTHTLVSDLFIAQTKEHLWQATSNTIQASNTRKLRNDAIRALVGNLKDQGLLD